MKNRKNQRNKYIYIDSSYSMINNILIVKIVNVPDYLQKEIKMKNWRLDVVVNLSKMSTITIRKLSTPCILIDHKVIRWKNKNAMRKKMGNDKISIRKILTIFIFLNP